MSFLTKIFGDANERYLRKLKPIVEKINSLEQKFERFSDGELKERAKELKEKARKSEDLDDFLPEAFALVREAAKRTLHQRHFDVQLIGGIVLHQGKIAQMLTGEGKTLTATLPAFLNALSGKGVHIVTVNDYLARRDTVWMGQIYHFLGLSVGCLNHEQAFLYDPEYKKPDAQKDKIRDELGGFKVVEDFLRPCKRKEAYLADITYGTNNEFGFDFLRDNMAYDESQLVQRELNFAILDEIDFILIDEARTPLIISAPDTEAAKLYKDFARIIPQLQKDLDYEVDEKLKIVTLTEKGIEKLEKILKIKNLFVEKGIDYLHHLEQALRAKELFQRDRDYIVKDGKVIIVDEFTGRLMPGRRWSGGLHQAIEAKENVKILPESRTLATITFQNYFRLYKKLAGMTGTAISAAEEFDKVYGLDVICVPTNKPMIRKDLPDRIYRTKAGKFRAIVEEVKKRHQKGQPILIGTRSIQKNEYLARLLKKEGLNCQVLNAKNHEKEAQIIAQAGKLGAITVATNMAGRGVDIILGGNPQDKKEAEKVKALGGLHVIGTERHEARRIDNQLRGRAGRQGDPGSSQFFLSLEDELLKVFGGERIEKLKALMEKTNFPETEPIESTLVSKAIEAAQAKIEGLHFDIRKNLLDYDNVMSRHREVFYQKRREILKAKPEKLREILLDIWQRQNFSIEDFLEKEKSFGKENFLKLAKIITLQTLDFYWMLHLEDMEWLRESVRLRALSRLDPLVEYKTEGYKLFQEMMSEAELSLIKTLSRIGGTKSQILTTQTVETVSAAKAKKVFPKKKPGRNDPCPCGKIDPKTGKPIKYKKCCWPKYG